MKYLFSAFLLSLMVFVVQGATIFSDDFSTLKTNWQTYGPATWAVTNGVASGTTSSGNAGGYAYVVANVTNSTVTSLVRFTNTTSWGLGVVTRYNPASGANYSAWIYSDGRMTIEEYGDWFNTWTALASRTIPSPSTNWHTLSLTVTNNTITATYDTSTTLTATDSTLTKGSYGLTFWSSANPTRAQFDNFSVTSSSSPPPPSHTNIVITLSWQPVTNALIYDVYSTTNLTQPFVLLASTMMTNISFTYAKSDQAHKQRFYYVKAQQAIWGTNNNNPASVTLAWDYSCLGTLEDVSGYKIYYGVGSRAYTNVVSVSPCTNRIGTVTNLPRGTTYYFAATALAPSGLESDYSNEVSWFANTNTLVGTNVLNLSCKISAVR